MIGGLLLIALGVLGYMQVTPWIILPFAAVFIAICSIGLRSFDRRAWVMSALRVALTVVAYAFGVWAGTMV